MYEANDELDRNDRQLEVLQSQDCNFMPQLCCATRPPNDPPSVVLGDDGEPQEAQIWLALVSFQM